MKSSHASAFPAHHTFDVAELRKDFPVLHQKAYGKPLVYFDNAATSQKPSSVIHALSEYYSTTNANIHRGVHYLSQKASQAFDDVRAKVQQFIHAGSEKEIIFVRGTTEGINLVAATFGRMSVSAGDEILVSAMEHHSNIVPWQLLCEEKKAVLKVIPMSDEGVLDMEAYISLLSSRTRLVSVVHTSNSLGTINPVKDMIRLAHQKGIPVLVDAAQAVVHEPIDVQDLDCDFLAFSGHKMLGPTGVGVLYGKLDHLEKMPPYQGGGEMIHSVSFAKTTFNEVPYKFEAGTPNIADVIALGVAIDYLQSMDRSAALNHELGLMEYASLELSKINGLRLIGTSTNKSAVVSFVIDGLNALDVGMYLDTLGIAVRTGHHCTEPVMQRMGIPGTIRASFMFYNTYQEVEQLITGVKKAIELLK
ncbi:MAG TPA: cysteine desulfurase [Bacteroidia bacterium]|nr:cysteine desulfurase [Bacteroidia bacterium]